MPRTRSSILISPLEKLGLSRLEAAAFIGVPPTTFDSLVVAGDMPPARRVGAFERWDRRQIESAFSLLPETTPIQKPSPYSDVA